MRRRITGGASFALHEFAELETNADLKSFGLDKRYQVLGVWCIVAERESDVFSGNPGTADGSRSIRVC